MEKSIIINQDLTFKEIISSLLYYSLSSKRLRLFILFLVGLSLLSSLLGFLTTTKFDIIEVLKDLAILPIFLMFAATLLSIMCLILYKMKPALFKIKYEFNHWGMHWDNGSGQFSKAWREVLIFKETRSFFLIYTDKINVHTIQKRLLKELDGVDFFRRLLEENIKH